MEHTPAIAAGDDRALRLLERTPVSAVHRERLSALVRAAQVEAAARGVEMQAEFGVDHVGLIVRCNQFLRVMRAGPEPGAVELRLDPMDQEELRAAGFSLRDPEGAVFRLFGWRRLDPMQAGASPLESAVRKAVAKALAGTKA